MKLCKLYFLKNTFKCFLERIITKIFFINSFSYFFIKLVELTFLEN
jgi:hypothetical protein